MDVEVVADRPAVLVHRTEEGVADEFVLHERVELPHARLVREDGLAREERELAMRRDARPDPLVGDRAETLVRQFRRRDLAQDGRGSLGHVAHVGHGLALARAQLERRHVDVRLGAHLVHDPSALAQQRRRPLADLHEHGARTLREEQIQDLAHALRRRDRVGQHEHALAEQALPRVRDVAEVRHDERLHVLGERGVGHAAAAVLLQVGQADVQVLAEPRPAREAVARRFPGLVHSCGRILCGAGEVPKKVPSRTRPSYIRRGAWSAVAARVVAALASDQGAGRSPWNVHAHTALRTGDVDWRKIAFAAVVSLFEVAKGRLCIAYAPAISARHENPRLV